ncbi:hypothetical protein SELMODRAFT_421528 [Selaginella moellendorffii]|uniref:Fe2OG dioxygenase domain-containing protein n=1 Tax=Selaginella moellendorffii TaxID=88036 RepID=D8SFJ9_SELML|nr:probable 2-oxoglutarate-dependent dioxygenase At3g50210 isoform X2 [Selaginella moellendorffii]EFJ16739.1 hypothetical protein SELMODRAFT_421528 [Selaginella moellendorffii]|eukprot:XP_002982071.1 probable 2-oxoglutarate-dependent dioxygenase At3g50210 isoform X2 [Selaginella moellendorffii]
MAPHALDSIPTIDVEPLVRRFDDPGLGAFPDVRDVIEQLDHACRNIGFFYAAGHGVSRELMDDVRSLSHEFFKLPDCDKMRIKMTPSSGYRGYQKLGENVSYGMHDCHEAIDYFRELGPEIQDLELAKTVMGPNQWPENPKRFRAVMEDYVDQLRGLSKAILRGVALALGGEADTFEGSRAGDPFWILRVIGYPPKDSLESPESFGIGCGEHTDYGLLTLVNQDPEIPALQVKNCSGKWLWADPVPGTFVVNIGDMLKIWSNGTYQPTLHRVLNSAMDFRVSVPFFYEPNFDTKVEPLSFCLGNSKEEEKPVVYGEHLVKKVLTNFA